MDETQLRKAIKEQGYRLTITLENGKICVANDGFVTDNPADITAAKHSMPYMGFYIQYKRKGTLNGLVDVVRAITRNTDAPAEALV